MSIVRLSPLQVTLSTKFHSSHTWAVSSTQSVTYISTDIQHRTKLASAAFGRLSQSVFFNRNLTPTTKIAVYNVYLFFCTVAKPGSCTDVTSKQGILGLRWWHKVPHVEIRRRANSYSMKYIIMQRQLRWLATSSECHPIVFLTAYCMESLFMARDHKVVRRSASLIT